MYFIHNVYVYNIPELTWIDFINVLQYCTYTHCDIQILTMLLLNELQEVNTVPHYYIYTSVFFEEIELYVFRFYSQQIQLF